MKWLGCIDACDSESRRIFQYFSISISLAELAEGENCQGKPMAAKFDDEAGADRTRPLPDFLGLHHRNY